MTGRAFTARELAAHVNGRLLGDPETLITGLAPLDRAAPGDLSHLSSPAWRRHLATTEASLVIVTASNASAVQGAALVVENPYLAYARLSPLFDAAPALAIGIAAEATIDPSAMLAADVAVAAGAVIGAGARIGAGTQVGAAAVIGPGAVIGEQGRIHPGAVLCHGVVLGDRCIVHPNAVIGADGFGFTADERGRQVRIAQIGSVRIGDDVEIGASTTVDRGAIDDTIIEDGVKIDNQVQIGHNCRIGRDTVICGCCGIVGSSVIGARCVLAGGVGVGGDGPTRIADDSVISGMTHVSRSIDSAGVYSSGTLLQPSRRWKRSAVRFSQLDDMARRLAALERRLAAEDGDGADTSVAPADRKDRGQQ
ncbi:MAG TPA: UDP-3-O-(3-hydroxymyristoyl)glucosamine N-acyltransferase [Pseudomonadales bacterium]|nr:UDP-3-O-(3-hydroxymyristoyl)glucosamine N-acyltransferase [Pseudomonadales bacterium]